MLSKFTLVLRCFGCLFSRWQLTGGCSGVRSESGSVVSNRIICLKYDLCSFSGLPERADENDSEELEVFFASFEKSFPHFNKSKVHRVLKLFISWFFLFYALIEFEISVILLYVLNDQWKYFFTFPLRSLANFNFNLYFMSFILSFGTSKSYCLLCIFLKVHLYL